jgi:hypothetical protein
VMQPMMQPMPMMQPGMMMQQPAPIIVKVWSTQPSLFIWLSDTKYLVLHKLSNKIKQKHYFQISVGYIILLFINVHHYII